MQAVRANNAAAATGGNNMSQQNSNAMAQQLQQARAQLQRQAAMQQAQQQQQQQQQGMGQQQQQQVGQPQEGVNQPNYAAMAIKASEAIMNTKVCTTHSCADLWQDIVSLPPQTVNNYMSLLGKHPEAPEVQAAMQRL
jgi:hypothetical protein